MLLSSNNGEVKIKRNFKSLGWQNAVKDGATFQTNWLLKTTSALHRWIYVC